MDENTKSTDLTVLDMYNRIFLDSSYTTYSYAADANGNVIEKMDKANSMTQDEIAVLEQETDSYKFFLRTLWQIENFVTQVISCDSHGFIVVENKLGKMIPKKEEPLGKYFKWVYQYAIEFLPEYQYSPHVQLFFDCYIKLRLGEVIFNNPNGPTPWKGKKQFEIFNDFLNLIRKESKTPAFRKKISRAKEKAEKRYRSAELYIDALFKNRSTKLLVLRLDLAYRREHAKGINVSEAKEDLAHLLNNRRSKPKLFRGWVGYIRKIEWSPQKGVHFHLVIFFCGHQREQDSYLARSIGDYWVRTTENRGTYWNCNDSKHDYKRCGIGMLETNDDEKRKILLDDVINYLAKNEQLLRPSELKSEGDKLFVTGIKPHERTSKAGRPRKNVMA